MCSVDTILMTGPIPVNNLLEFHFHRQRQNYRFLYHPTPNTLLQITKQVLLQVSTRSFLCTRKTLLNIGRVTRNYIFQALQQFLCRKPRCWAILEKYRRCRLFLCVAAIAVLLFSNKATICISSRFYCGTIAFVICMTDFTAKMLQVRYFVIRCEAKFSKVRLKIFKCTLMKCLLDSQVA